MISFFSCLIILIGGYFIYGKVVEKVYGPDDRETPAVRLSDGVDYVTMPTWKLFTIQLLNIAGLGWCFVRSTMGTICIPMDYIGNYSRWWRTRFFSWLFKYATRWCVSF